MTNGRRLRVLMLGWEYPPHITGGLGTACEGLTRALAPHAVDIDFVVPHLFGTEQAPHMHLTSPEGRLETHRDAAEPSFRLGPRESPHAEAPDTTPGLHITALPALLSPYLSEHEYKGLRARVATSNDPETLQYFDGLDPLPRTPSVPAAQPGLHYGEDLFREVARYSERVQHAMRDLRPDVVHAHDWMTFPAASELARLHRVPLVLHVHSLEQDRSPHGGNPTILAIEGSALRAATRVIAVSHYTARMVHEVHGVPLQRIDVVHNGVYPRKAVSSEDAAPTDAAPTVLFLGRITYQKGPEYFVEAAAKVLEEIPHARFIMAGSGDMQPHIEARVRALGIDESFEFPGFVVGAEVERLFSTADVYVMPSVSEPFGISALEAMSYETPVILSRQSGASEILKHALKVDFWDIHKLAAQIISVLRFPELRRSLVEMAREEVRRVHWEASAEKVLHVYQQALKES